MQNVSHSHSNVFAQLFGKYLQLNATSPIGKESKRSQKHMYSYIGSGVQKLGHLTAAAGTDPYLRAPLHRSQFGLIWTVSSVRAITERKAQNRNSIKATLNSIQFSKNDTTDTWTGAPKSSILFSFTMGSRYSNFSFYNFFPSLCSAAFNTFHAIHRAFVK